MLFMDSALHVVDGEPLPEPTYDDGPTAEQLEKVALRTATDGSVDVSELRYEVMFLLNLDDTKLKKFKNAWGEIGDSIVVVGGDGLYNCHIHTNDIGAAVEAPLIVGGRPSKIRITDLFEEMAEEHAQREESLGAPVEVLGGSRSAGRSVSRQAALPPVICAVVAVASGDGLAELFGQMGVHGVVTGGQTMNPSTQELLDAVEHMNANQVVILPNNKNIIPVANKIDELTKKMCAWCRHVRCQKHSQRWSPMTQRHPQNITGHKCLVRRVRLQLVKSLKRCVTRTPMPVR